jgi:hypothetical protein
LEVARIADTTAVAQTDQLHGIIGDEGRTAAWPLNCQAAICGHEHTINGV